jgi:hypothetical protein
MGREAVGHYTKRRGGASRLGTSVAVHHTSFVASPLRVTVMCVPVVVGEAVWKVDWGALYAPPTCRCSAVVAASVSGVGTRTSSSRATGTNGCRGDYSTAPAHEKSCRVTQSEMYPQQLPRRQHASA